MTYIEEWHRQQKALKEADRQKKKGAANNLRNYRSGTQQAAWVQKQKALKDADRQSREVALVCLKSYKGGEHDVKEYERMVAKYRQELIEQSRERALQQHRECHGDTDSAGDMFEENWQEIVEQHIKEFEQMAAEHRLQQFDCIETNPQKELLEAAHTEGGVENGMDKHDPLTVPTPSKFLCSSESRYKAATKVDGREKETLAIEEKEALATAEVETFASEEVETLTTKEMKTLAIEEVKTLATEAVTTLAIDEVERKSPGHSEKSLLHRSKEETKLDDLDPLMPLTPAMEKIMIELDFSFGLIYHNINTPPPTMSACSAAAAKIVPVSLGKTLKHTLHQMTWDSRSNAVVKTVTIDPEFDHDDAIRYVVKGTIPVNVHISVNQDQNGQRLERTLQRSSSTVIIGKRNEEQWRCVRKGEIPSWNNILRQKIGFRV
jgi:hypothetical protein